MNKTKIYVGGISYNATEDDLENHFNQFGNIKEINLIYDRETGRSKGFAFIDFESQTSAEAAIKSNGQQLHNRNLRVNIAQDRKRK
ncbi:MAG: RNA-binding protein [Legionellales bacterium]|nr:RNA-binding protein [Legionellales bacterium]